MAAAGAAEPGEGWLCAVLERMTVLIAAGALCCTCSWLLCPTSATHLLSLSIFLNLPTAGGAEDPHAPPGCSHAVSAVLSLPTFF